MINNVKCKEEIRSKYVSSKFTLNSHKILHMGNTIVLTGAGGVLCGKLASNSREELYKNQLTRIVMKLMCLV